MLRIQEHTAVLMVVNVIRSVAREPMPTNTNLIHIFVFKLPLMILKLTTSVYYVVFTLDNTANRLFWVDNCLSCLASAGVIRSTFAVIIRLSVSRWHM